jgi:hypothetical protein
VLRPGGFLGLIWNVRDESLDWTAAMTARHAFDYQKRGAFGKVVIQI